jgi:serine/threonine protein kinase
MLERQQGKTKLTLKNTHQSKLMSGGKYLDKGGFGCVIIPALPCSKKDLTEKNLKNYVSKLIKDTDSETLNEITISNILKKLDPNKKYFLTIEKHCYINNISSEISESRSDIALVNYIDDDMKKFNLQPGQKNKDKHFCDIDISKKPINIIMEYAGYSLKNVMKTQPTDNSTKGIMHRLFLANIKNNLKHLILGLIKMHFNRIAHRDVKTRNIMLLYNKQNNDIQIRYGDFGLSELLTNSYCSDINNVYEKGTPNYISPELKVVFNYRYYRNRSDNYILGKITDEFNNKEGIKKAFTDINEIQLLGDLNTNILALFKKIKTLFITNRILPIFFGTDNNKFNGYVQKADVYALGYNIFNMLLNHSNFDIQSDPELYDLLIHMIAMDPDKRFNAVQCISHPYFQ